MLMWFRRDLRVADNPALVAAVDDARANGKAIAALFVADPRLIGPAGTNRVAFLVRSLRALAERGVPLIVRTGDPAVVVPDVAASVGTSNVFAAHDYGPYGRARDERVRDALANIGARLELTGSPYAVEPGSVRTNAGAGFQVFTPFHRAWIERAHREDPVDAPDIDAVDWRTDIASDALPIEPADLAATLPDASEQAAYEAWMDFRDHIGTYTEERNRPDLDRTSRLSPYLKFGQLHPRQLLAELRSAKPETGEWVFRSELAWREFYADVLNRRPETARANYLASMDTMRTDIGPRADRLFEAWCEGRTGFPFIDAGMRQLLREGWMHNRVRMAVASFLVKDLHLDWQRGAAWFMRHLVDGDLASNQHGWQWTAGTGTDAAPYFRIFNPTSQGRTFDPTGAYIRRYVDELREFTGDIHEPHAPKTRRESGSLFDQATSYPHPIVDHAAERAEALARLKQRATQNLGP